MGREVVHCQGCMAKVVSGLKSSLGSTPRGCSLAWDCVHPEEGTPFPNLYEGILCSRGRAGKVPSGVG